MKKVFTLILALTVVFAGFAQVKSKVSHKQFKKTAQQVVVTGFEERDFVNVPLQPKHLLAAESETELSQSYYDWQSNAAKRNFTAVWPDGYAVMCYTQSMDENYTTRGTGLAIWDPAVGEWEYTENRVESVKTGFGSIARYKENGLVIAAHTATDLRIFIVEDFRDGNRSFGEGEVLPAPAGSDPCWPVVQCSGENLDIIHVLCTNNGATSPYTDPIVYYRRENGEWTHQCEIIPPIDATQASDCGSNVCYFINYDPAKPNRVGFVLNNAWSDCKAVISEDNGDNWEDKVFWRHPGINQTMDDWFMYPRWTDVAFDSDDVMHVVYEFNGSTGEPGSGSYYPSIGGVGYWSEILPLNDSCVGGIGEIGGPFIMDTTYIYNDIYATSLYWSDATHCKLPEFFGDLVSTDGEGVVLPQWDDPEGIWPNSNVLDWGEHGKYNSGKTAFPTMYYDKATDRIFAFWSMVAGSPDAGGLYHYDATNKYRYRLFCSVSFNGGRTWEYPVHVLNDFMNTDMEMAYPQVIPFLYSDSNGEYLWVCYQKDEEPGTNVMYGSDDSDDPEASNNFYYAAKIYVDKMWDGVQENNVVAPIAMKVYPNPANGSFTMELNQESDVNIFNAVGQLVKSYKNVKDLNVNLKAGIYFVQAGNQTQKVIVL